LRTWTLEWLGFPIAVTGLALWLGRPSWRVAVLAFGLVSGSREHRGRWHNRRRSRALLSGCVRDLAARGRGRSFVHRAGGASRFTTHLELGYGDVGWTLAWLLAQLGWFRAVILGKGGARRAAQAAST
jgi:hypothetical protein